MALTRAELSERVEHLDEVLPQLQADYPDQDEFWNAFAGEAEFALEEASAADYDWVNKQVDLVLKKHHIEIPADESPTDG
jgi:hypothetical protein